MCGSGQWCPGDLFKPGSTPSQNARFLLFLAAFIKGVDEYQDLLRTFFMISMVSWLWSQAVLASL